MKIRSSFVGNSSSSSFVCDACGHTEGGYNESLSDFDMCMCAQHHILCCECKSNVAIKDVQELSADVLIDLLTGWREAFESTKLEDLQEAALDYLRWHHDNNQGEVILSTDCPVCTLQVISDATVLSYLLEHHLDMTRENIKDMIRHQFTSLQDLQEKKKKVNKE